MEKSKRLKNFNVLEIEYYLKNFDCENEKDLDQKLTIAEQETDKYKDGLNNSRLRLQNKLYGILIFILLSCFFLFSHLTVYSINVGVVYVITGLYIIKNSLFTKSYWHNGNEPKYFLRKEYLEWPSLAGSRLRMLIESQERIDYGIISNNKLAKTLNRSLKLLIASPIILLIMRVYFTW